MNVDQLLKWKMQVIQRIERTRKKTRLVGAFMRVYKQHFEPHSSRHVLRANVRWSTRNLYLLALLFKFSLRRVMRLGYIRLVVRIRV